MIIPVNTGEKSYNIILERGALKRTGEYIKIPQDRRVLVVTDSGVPEIYGKTVASFYKNSTVYTFPQGEENKSFETYRLICEKLLSLSFTRKDVIIAVGGGVVGDIAGFAAATYMRGIAFYNIPTTLLSQVDSSIGGKTAVDLGRYKNIIGAFHQPEGVLIDPEVLSTLSDRHIKNGLAEALKAGVIMDPELFAIFEKGESGEKTDEIIERSLLVKKAVVEEDEKEGGLRRVLNFGHTIGHAIESSVGLGELYHGECVAMGMIPMCGADIRQRVISAIEKTGLPLSTELNMQSVAEALIHDKKSSGNKITAVISNEIGKFEFIETDGASLMKRLGD